MKTPFTRPGQPADLVDRWGTLERILTGPLEESCLAILRHITLSCTTCKQEDIILKLVEHRFTMREAVLTINLLLDQHLNSTQAAQDRLRISSLKQPVLHHDAHGRPVPADGSPVSGIE